MKTIAFLALTAAALLATGLSSQAQEVADGPREGKPHGRDRQAPRGSGRGPSEGLQLSGRLQTSSLQLSPSLSPRLSDADWRKRFPIADPAQK